MTGSAVVAGLSPIDAQRARAYAVLVDAMAAAAQRGDIELVDALGDRVFESTAGTARVAAAEARLNYYRWLNISRIALTGVLVLALAGLILVSVLPVQGVTSAAAAPYISIFSGLVGISIGWMFGGTRSSAEPEGAVRTIVQDTGSPAGHPSSRRFRKKGIS